MTAACPRFVALDPPNRELAERADGATVLGDAQISLIPLDQVARLAERLDSLVPVFRV